MQPKNFALAVWDRSPLSRTSVAAMVNCFRLLVENRVELANPCAPPEAVPLKRRDKEKGIQGQDRVDVRREEAHQHGCGRIQKNAHDLEVDPAVLREVHGQDDGGHEKKHAADPQGGVLYVSAQKIRHEIDQIRGLRVPEQVAEAEDRVDAEEAAYKRHDIMEGCLIFFYRVHCFHLSLVVSVISIIAYCKDI